MNRRKAIQSALLGAAAAAPVPLARAATKDLEVVLDRWDKAKAFTLAVADAMPAESYDFKPKPEMRPYGELMVHIASGNAFYMSRLRGGELPESLRHPPKTIDPATARQFLTDSFDFCAGVLKSTSDAELNKSYPGRPNQPPATGWDWLLNAFIHTAHHRGYAEVYLREKGITPPRYSV
jgi:uncharacterized damage-inducible protein DinB